MGVTMANSPGFSEAGPAVPTTGRLFYLDWLRVLATLGVFLFHVTNVFSGVRYEIVNAETSDFLIFVAAFFYPWGMPLFFLVAGAASWFALRRRTASQFRHERVYRILVPFLTGTLVLGPVQIYLSWRHLSETGVFSGTLLDFFYHRFPGIGPKLFGAYGYHMWFLGFLFAFSLLALPIFIWLKGVSGRGIVSWLARLCTKRGGILIFIVPPTLLRLGLQPFFPSLQDWADFFTYGAFFILGFLLYADDRFSRAIWRDWRILLGVGLVSIAAATVIGATFELADVEKAPRTFWELSMWALIGVCGWCWVAVVLSLGMRFMNRDSQALRYGQVTLLPFFVVHQPAILAVAYFVVQWQASIGLKLVAVALGSFVISIGLCELVIKRVRVLRLLFGMKDQQPSWVRMAIT